VLIDRFWVQLHLLGRLEHPKASGRYRQRGGSRGPDGCAGGGTVGGTGRAEPERGFADGPGRVVPGAALEAVPALLRRAGRLGERNLLQTTAIGWLVLQVTGSASSLRLVLAAGGLPSLLLGPWGGSIADRVDLRKLLIGTQTVFGLLAAGLWIVAATGHAGVALVVTINLIGGFVQIVDSPARQAFVSALVEPADLTSAISLNGVVMNSARVVGPAIAGVLIVTVGTTPCFAVNAVSYAAVVVALVLIRPIAAGRPANRAPAGVVEGLRYARSRQQLWLPPVDDVAGRAAVVQLPGTAAGAREAGLQRRRRHIRAAVDDAQRRLGAGFARGRADPASASGLPGGRRAGFRGVPRADRPRADGAGGQHRLAAHRGGGVQLRHTGLDDAAVALGACLPRPDHGAVGVRLRGYDPNRQRALRVDQ
jgi:hypothetical protein